MIRAGVVASVGLLATFVACSQDVTLVLAPRLGCDSSCGQRDLSCLKHVGFAAIGGTDDEAVTMCVPVPPGAVQSMCDHQLGDLIGIPLPANLDRVEVIGFASESGCDTTTLFGGGATYDQGSSLRIPVSCNLDCATMAHRNYDVSLVDLRALVEESRCAAPAAAQDFSLWLGVLHDVRRFEIEPYIDIVFEPFEDVLMDSAPTVDGRLSMSGQSFAVDPGDGGCLSVDAASGAERWNTSCVAPANVASSGCSPSGAVEVPWVDARLAATIESMLSELDLFEWYFVGVVWDPWTGEPVQRAVVSELPADVAIVYPVLLDGVAFPSSFGHTSASGLFVVTGRMVNQVAITAPGFQRQMMPIAIPAFNPAAGIVSLSR